MKTPQSINAQTRGQALMVRSNVVLQQQNQYESSMRTDAFIGKATTEIVQNLVYTDKIIDKLLKIKICKSSSRSRYESLACDSRCTLIPVTTVGASRFVDDLSRHEIRSLRQPNVR